MGHLYLHLHLGVNNHEQIVIFLKHAQKNRKKHGL